MVKELFNNSLYAGVVLSLVSYFAGVYLKKKLKWKFLNPLAVSIIISILVLVIFKLDYEVYNSSAKYLSWFLTPATVSLAIPLYERFEDLKKNSKAIMIGLLSGVVTSLFTVFVLSLVFKLNHAEYVTLLPKSVTTAIGMGISQELGGYVTITVAVIIITGILGNVAGPLICRIFRIENEISKGLAIGCASHAIGTAKAMELGETEGAMSSLAITVCGILTVIIAPLFASFI